MFLINDDYHGFQEGKTWREGKISKHQLKHLLEDGHRPRLYNLLTWSVYPEVPFQRMCENGIAPLTDKEMEQITDYFLRLGVLRKNEIDESLLWE